MAEVPGEAGGAGMTRRTRRARLRLRPRELVLYTRARCGVCRDAEARVRREVRRTLPWRRPAVRLVDVDADPEGEGLADRYGVRVPVIVLDGVELSELELAPGVVRRALSGRALSGRVLGDRGMRGGLFGRRGAR